MHTIKLQLDDNLYEEMVQSGIDIKEKFQEFLTHYVDDGYPDISTEEAKKRVSQAVERYENGSGTYLNEEEYEVHRSQHLENLKIKYANH